MSNAAAAASPAGAIGGRRHSKAVGAVPGRATTVVVLVVVGVVFLIPMLAMLRFTLLDGSGGFTLQHYAAVFDPAQNGAYADLFAGIVNSLAICVVTVAIVLLLLVPAMLITELRHPRLGRALEFICLLPLSIPTVVLVVGFVPVYQVLGGTIGSDPWTLAFAIGVIVLPFAYRPIQTNLRAVPVVILSEAARSLGASWFAVVLRVLLPNLRRGIVSAAFLTMAVVLGEFTIATFLGQNTFQTALLLLQQSDPYVATIFALFSLLFVFVLLVVLGRLGSITRSRRSS